MKRALVYIEDEEWESIVAGLGDEAVQCCRNNEDLLEAVLPINCAVLQVLSVEPGEVPD